MKLQCYSQKQIDTLTELRPHETRIGERIKILNDNWKNSLSNYTSPYVLLGIPEDVGIKANRGRPGARSAWKPALKRLLNQQSNAFLKGDEILLLGYLDCSDLLNEADNINSVTSYGVERLRDMVALIDDEVSELVQGITESGKIPIVIGGGHNNAYGIIKGSANGFSKNGKIPKAQISCINLDAHSDFRQLEGRHSGNGFSYAFSEKLLGKYFVLGLQESSLQENIRKQFEGNPNLGCIFFEDIGVRENFHFKEAMDMAIAFIDHQACGIELDLDCVRNIPCSATTFSGFDTNQTRQYVNRMAQQTNACYLHICEGAPSLAPNPENDQTGKLIALLISDFIKGKNKIKM